MAKTKQQKEQNIQTLVDGIKNAKSVVFANFQGLKVTESEELRAICRKQNISYIASKKTLLKKALTDAGFEVDTKAFKGGVAVVFGYEDEVAAAQTIADYANKHQLLGQLVGTLNAPISGFVNVLAGNIRGLVNVLNGIKEAKA